MSIEQIITEMAQRAKEASKVVAQLSTGEKDQVLNCMAQKLLDEAAKIKEASRRVKRILRKLGCIVPPGMTRVRPMGASVHYAGTLPMTQNPSPFKVGRDCRSFDISNLYLADGSSFCDLPAKNLTFSLMANARRIVSESF